MSHVKVQYNTRHWHITSYFKPCGEMELTRSQCLSLLLIISGFRLGALDRGTTGCHLLYARDQLPSLIPTLHGTTRMWVYVLTVEIIPSLLPAESLLTCLIGLFGNSAWLFILQLPKLVTSFSARRSQVGKFERVDLGTAADWPTFPSPSSVSYGSLHPVPLPLSLCLS